MSTSPAVDAPRCPVECAEGMVEAARRLRTELGIDLQFSDRVPAADLAWWDSVANTLIIRADAPLIDQVWVLAQAWLYLVVGPDASACAVPEPRLVLVPAPRSSG